MLPLPDKQHKVGTSIPLNVHTGPIGNRLSTLPAFISSLSLAPIHGANALNPITHSEHKDLAEKITAHITVSLLAAVKPRTVKCESFVSALICGCADM